MSKSLAKDLREIERLRRLLKYERERAEKAWSGYLHALYQLTDVRMQLDKIKAIINQGQEIK